ncbi:MAG: radical SAM protein [Sandaracinaceae bacterium]|nr:radical SAM protein [Sandaracinaceae bacterium]
MKALIKVGYGCNDHCSFCHTLDVRHVDAEAAEVHAKIERAKALGHSMVVLSGGEPTIRPELLAWASHVARLGMDFGLVTNGRMLSYPSLVDELARRRLRYVYLSLHGGTAKVHDLMVRSQAFEETYGAIAVLSGRGLDFTVNCVITRHNVEHLRGLVDAVRPYEDVRLKLSMVEPKGGGAALFEHLMPRVSDVAAKVRDAIDYARSLGMDRVSHGAIPLCLMRGYEDAFDDLKTHRFATMIEVGEPDFYPVDDLNKVQPEASCRGCSASGPCPGLYRGYHETFGHAELSPIRDRPRSNSFHWVLEETVEAPRREGCPLLRDGVSPWDRGRHLFVRHGDRVARFFTPTRDFSDAELVEIKHARGQLYVDVAREKAAPDDFARDLCPLERSAVCAGCPERARCTGLFEPRLDDTRFARADARVRAHLARLEGDVLDVGAGHGRYLDVLAARAGAIRYRALDPDPAAVAALAARGLDARVASAEGWAREAAPASLDHVLVSRSWNHLADPHAFAIAVERALRPGGELFVADDAAFGLARTRAQAARAERSLAALEHYRNDVAADAARALAEAAPGLEELERHEVVPGEGTLWTLRLRKTR